MTRAKGRTRAAAPSSTLMDLPTIAKMRAEGARWIDVAARFGVCDKAVRQFWARWRHLVTPADSAPSSAAMSANRPSSITTTSDS